MGGVGARVAIIGAETVTEAEQDAAFAARWARLESYSEAARQILFDLYAQSRFEPAPPTVAEIDA